MVRRILNAINSVGRPDSVVYMHVAEHVTSPLVIICQLCQVSEPLVGKHVVLLGETAGIHVQLLVTLQLHVQIQDANSLSQLLVLVAE